MPEVVLAPRLCLSAEQIPFPSCCIFLPAKAQEGPEPWQDAGCTGPVGRPLEASPALCSSAGLLGSPSLRGQAAEAQTPQVPAEDSADAETAANAASAVTQRIGECLVRTSAPEPPRPGPNEACHPCPGAWGQCRRHSLSPFTHPFPSSTWRLGLFSGLLSSRRPGLLLLAGCWGQHPAGEGSGGPSQARHLPAQGGESAPAVTTCAVF